MEIALSPIEFANRARRLYADREAVVDGDLRFTYREFLDRCDRWTVGTSGSQVPATTWLDNGVEKPLINSAGDPIGGYNKRRLEMRLTVSGNRASSQIATAKAVVNATNSAGWGGGAARSWLCSGATARERTELVGTLVVNGSSPYARVRRLSRRSSVISVSGSSPYARVRL